MNESGYRNVILGARTTILHGVPGALTGKYWRYCWASALSPWPRG